MNKISLTGPTVRNDRTYVDAGVELEVGDKGHQISADRAAGLVKGFGMADAPTATAAKEIVAAADKAAPKD